LVSLDPEGKAEGIGEAVNSLKLKFTESEVDSAAEFLRNLRAQLCGEALPRQIADKDARVPRSPRGKAGQSEIEEREAIEPTEEFPVNLL
jgi:hypothetical protein